MRILFVHEVNYLSKVVYEMHEFPELLALAGHEITFLHFPENPARRRVRLRSTAETISGRAYPTARLTLVTPPTWGGSLLERICAAGFTVPKIRALLRHGRFDLVVIYSVPTTGWQTVLLARRYGVPSVFRALDVSHLIRETLLSPLIALAERAIYRSATLLSANNPAMANYCLTVSGRKGRALVNLPPVDLSHFEKPLSPEALRLLRSRFGLDEEHRVIAYMGSFFSFSGLDVVLADLVAHFKVHPELRLLLIGGGDLDARLRDMVRERGLEDRVIFTGVIDYAELTGYLHLAHVAINPFVPELLTNVALPHKVLQYMAAGVPALSTSLTGLRGVLGDKSGVRWVAGPHDVAALATSIALQSRVERLATSQVQRQAARKLFSREAALRDFEEALESVR